MANRVPREYQAGYGGNGNTYGNGSNFERNRNRQTMPTNSRFNPISPQNHRNGGNYRHNHQSPTQSHISTATTYEQPWNSQPWHSPKFRAPAPPDEEPRFRRTHSMAARKFDKVGQKFSGGGESSSEGGGSSEKAENRPKINFKEFGKKITSKFKKTPKSEPKKGDRSSAPIIKLAETPSISHPQLPTDSSPSPAKKKKNNAAVAASSSMKMQPEDRLKMFQKMGREQAMKVSNLQRMQRERQRDFTLVLGPGRSSIESSNASIASSNHSIDSMMVFNTTPSSSRSQESLSMIDDDVEPVFKNSLTNRKVTSSQFNNQQKPKLSSGGPSFTSTPRLTSMSTSRGESPTISNVRSISESSFCLMSTPEATNNVNSRPDATIYYSADTLNKNPGRSRTDVTLASTASTPTSAPSAPSASSRQAKVKQEIIERSENQSSDCPSMSTTPSSDCEGLNGNVPSENVRRDNLWAVSKDIRDRQLELERTMPILETLRARVIELDQQKTTLSDTKGDNPSAEDMRLLWKLTREFRKVTKEFDIASKTVQQAHSLLPYLEMRRNELLSSSPTRTTPAPTPVLNSQQFQLPGSFV